MECSIAVPPRRNSVRCETFPRALRCDDWRVRKRWAMAAGVGAGQRDVGDEAEARRHQLQRWDQRVRERSDVAAGFGAAQRDVGGECGARLVYSAGISACEKGGQWQQALALMSDMREAKLEPDVIVCSAGISACEKGGQWERALALLSEMREAKVEPVSPGQLQRWNQRVRKWRTVATGVSAAARDVWFEGGARRHHLQCWHQRLREGRGVATGCGAAAQRDAWLGGEARPLISYAAAISACEKSEEWQQALALLIEMWEAKLELNVIHPTTLGSALARRAGSGSRLRRCSARCGRRGWSPTSSLLQCRAPRVRDGSWLDWRSRRPGGPTTALRRSRGHLDGPEKARRRSRGHPGSPRGLQGRPACSRGLDVEW
ncbi:unnamed protein product [Prorocentrum cordatum]|uniref:Pentatricopeptide repeat-containing protein, chloroplastic n=1 Tax=Prorocentrum cordatum TaxID=2364126 RepID=A0ABN9UVT4_9DINO|nr:unnamed protein product [Polarella glacialis]